MQLHFRPRSDDCQPCSGLLQLQIQLQQQVELHMLDGILSPRRNPDSLCRKMLALVWRFMRYAAYGLGVTGLCLHHPMLSQ